MAKVQITSKGIVGRDTKLILDGQDVSMYCSGLTLDMSTLGEPARLTATFLCKDIEIDLDDVELNLTESEASKEIRKYLAMKANA